MRVRRRPADLPALVAAIPALRILAARWPAAAGAMLLVGGAPRDWLLGRAPRDLDLVLESAGDTGERFLKNLAADLRGHLLVFDHRGLRERRLILPGQELDFVLVPSGGVEAELRRRDFTLNALAVRLPGGELLDPCGGMDDLAAGILRAVSPTVFREDPLRALRAVRLLAEDAADSLTTDTEAALRRAAADVAGCAGERIGVELDRIAASGRFAAALERMLDWALADAIMPEAAAMAGVTQNRYHHLDCWDHTVAAVALADDPAALAGSLAEQGLDPPAEPAGEDRLVLAWATFFHDVGKPATRTVDTRGQVHFYGHESLSADAVGGLGSRWRFSRARRRRVARLVQHHLRPGAVGPDATERALRRIAHAAGEDVDLLLMLALADTGATLGVEHEERLAGVAATGRRIRRLVAAMGADLTSPRPLLSGHEVMAITGLPPGPAVGDMLSALLRLQVDGEVRDREQAEAAVRRLASGGTDETSD